MLIANVDGQTVVEVADYRDIFPNTSFPPSGPSPEFLAENSCMTVTVWLPNDQATQVLEPAAPYIDGDTVYTVSVRDLTAEEIADKASAALQAKRQATIISPLQAKVELLERELLDEVEAVIFASTDPVIKLAWNSATEFARLSPLVALIAEAMGWDDVYLDALFNEAAKRTF